MKWTGQGIHMMKEMNNIENTQDQSLCNMVQACTHRIPQQTHKDVLICLLPSQLKNLAKEINHFVKVS